MFDDLGRTLVLLKASFHIDEMNKEKRFGRSTVYIRAKERLIKAVLEISEALQL